MTRKIHMAMMTQNELSDLIPNIESALPYVDTITVIDGGSIDGTIYYMRNWAKHEPKIRFYVNAWENNFPKQRNQYVARVSEIAEPGDYLLTCDPDEVFSEDTLQKLHKAADRADKDGYNMIAFQCYGVSLEGRKEVHRNLDEYWKPLMFKWDPNFHYAGALCHESIAGVPHRIMRVGLTYEHRKQENVIWIRGFRNLWTGGGGPNLGDRNPAWARLRSITDSLGFKTWADLHGYLVRGNVCAELKQFFVDHALEGMRTPGPNALSALYPDRFPEGWDGASEMREGYKAYFRIYHPEEEPEELKGVYIG